MERKKILLVGDLRPVLERQTALFHSEEFELLFARGGSEALQVAGELKPDLIVMEYYLPDMNGDRCCRALKTAEALRGIPVLMITAGVDESDFQRCWEAGCSDIIPRPINRNYFNAVVKRHLPAARLQPPRFVARLRVQYGVRQELELDDYSVNVSTGGLFIESSALLPVDSALTLAILLPDQQEALRCQARVAWVNHPEMLKNRSLPPGMGVQFLDLSLEDLQALRDFIKTGALLPFWSS